MLEAEELKPQNWLIENAYKSYCQFGFDNQQLKVQPNLPDFLPDLKITNLSVGDATVGLRFWRDGEQTQWEVVHLDGELEGSI